MTPTTVLLMLATTYGIAEHGLDRPDAAAVAKTVVGKFVSPGSGYFDDEVLMDVYDRAVADARFKGEVA